MFRFHPVTPIFLPRPLLVGRLSPLRTTSPQNSLDAALILSNLYT